MPAGDITQGYIFVPAEKSIDQVKMNAIVGQAYINPAFISAQTESTNTTTGDYFLLLKSGGTLAKIVLDNLASSLAATTGFQSQIWSVRLKSWNSIGNCNFEVDQRQAGISSTLTTNLGIDRWLGSQGGTNASSIQQINGVVTIPGTNFPITTKILQITLNTAQASLGATDILGICQFIEGPMFRELSQDVHSISVLARSSVAGLKFGVGLNSTSGANYSLWQLATLPTANTWTLITFPNIPVWPAGGTWGLNPGTIAYTLRVTLAAGASSIAPANGTWNAAAYYGANGQSNFAASTVGSTFQLAFIQHEPGPQCTTLIDCPFGQNLDGPMGCTRYYQKTYDYAVKPGTASNSNSSPYFSVAANVNPTLYFPYSKRLAKVPSVLTAYSTVTGAANAVRDLTNAFDRAVSGPVQFGETGFGGWSLTSIPATAWVCAFHYTADTGW
jgi:hypothetical protein